MNTFILKTVFNQQDRNFMKPVLATGRLFEVGFFKGDPVVTAISPDRAKTLAAEGAKTRHALRLPSNERLLSRV
jgi:hypothetical protein